MRELFFFNVREQNLKQPGQREYHNQIVLRIQIFLEKLIDFYNFFVFDLVFINVNLSDDVAVIKSQQNLLFVRKVISLEVFGFPGLVHDLNDVTVFVKLV